MMNIAPLDDIDRKLIDAMRHDNRTPARVLAEDLGLSTSAVLRRLRRLREEGVIIADISVINPLLTGNALTVYLLVSLNDRCRANMETFARALPEYHHVAGAWEVAGSADFLIKLQVETMQDYDDFVRSALDEKISHIAKTCIVLRTIVF